MKTGAKIALGAGVITAGLAAAGSIYVHDTLIPQQLAQDMNRELAALAPAEGREAAVVAGGNITVTRNGLFSYTANVPSMTIAANLGEGILKQTVTDPSTFTLGLSRPFNAAILAAAPQAGVTPSHVLIENAAPVTFKQSILAFVSADEVAELANLEGSCATVTLDSHVDGAARSDVLKLQDCAVKGAATDGMSTLDIEATLNVDYAGKVDANGVHDDSVAINVANVTVGGDALNGGAVKVENAGLSISYTGFDPVKFQNVLADNFTAGDLPTGIGASFTVKNMWFITPQGFAAMPPLSIEGSVEAKDLRSDTASLSVRYKYLMDQFADFNPLQVVQQPTRSDCAAILTNIPVRSVIDIFAAATETTPPDLEKAEQTVTNSGIALNVDCSAGNDLAAFSAALKADHKAQDGGFPGSGSLELNGVEQVINQAAMLMGPDAVMMAVMALQLAKQTETGGALWEYTIDKNGVMAINGQIVGSTNSMMSPRLRP